VIDSNNRHQISEIGNIGYYAFNEVLNMLRPYHAERKKILEKLFIYACDKIIAEIKNDFITKSPEI
jgi:hypothetical protein